MIKNCEICGKPSGMYPLCITHLKLKDEGKVVKCPNCGKWKLTEDECICTKQNKSTTTNTNTIINKKCIICDNETILGHLFCKDCYYEMLDYKDSFDKNAKLFELKDYYFNLRSNIYRMKTFDYIQSNCNKLMALATLSNEISKDESLKDRVINDIKDIIEKKKPKENLEHSIETKIQDSHKEELLRARDGHYVKSEGEEVIDDLLYELRIIHCYEKKVPISADEPTIVADWFIPIKTVREGIYIEYWGMNTKSYLENKERKRKTYKEHNIPLIEIEKDDYKDRQGLEDRLISEINALSKKYFRIDDYIKPF